MRTTVGRLHRIHSRVLMCQTVIAHIRLHMRPFARVIQTWKNCKRDIVKFTGDTLSSDAIENTTQIAGVARCRSNAKCLFRNIRMRAHIINHSHKTERSASRGSYERVHYDGYSTHSRGPTKCSCCVAGVANRRRTVAVRTSHYQYTWKMHAHFELLTAAFSVYINVLPVRSRMPIVSGIAERLRANMYVRCVRMHVDCTLAERHTNCVRDTNSAKRNSKQ